MLEIDFEQVSMDFDTACSNNHLEVFKDEAKFEKVISVCSKGKRFYRQVSDVIPIRFETNGLSDMNAEFVLSVRQVTAAENDALSNCGDNHSQGSKEHSHNGIYFTSIFYS